jgi:hypothetical protein
MVLSDIAQSAKLYFVVCRLTLTTFDIPFGLAVIRRVSADS